MAAPRSHTPKPWRQFGACTLFLRAPRADWPEIRHGFKTEFRGAANALTRSAEAQAPCLVVVYAIDAMHEYESELMVLERTWREHLARIDDESLRREGFESFAHFRRYWMARHRQFFEPMKEVQVYRLAPFTPDALTTIGEATMRRLYAEHLPPDLQPTEAA